MTCQLHLSSWFGVEVQQLLAFHTWHLGDESFECRDDQCIDFACCCVQVSFIFKDHSRAWTTVTTLMASCGTNFSTTRVSGVKEWWSQRNRLHSAFFGSKKGVTSLRHQIHTIHTMTHASWFTLITLLGLLLAIFDKASNTILTFCLVGAIVLSTVSFPEMPEMSTWVPEYSYLHQRCSVSDLNKISRFCLCWRLSTTILQHNILRPATIPQRQKGLKCWWNISHCEKWQDHPEGNCRSPGARTGAVPTCFFCWELSWYSLTLIKPHRILTRTTPVRVSCLLILPFPTRLFGVERCRKCKGSNRRFAPG